MIDVVGHFGSQLSFATVSDNVALGLHEKGALGNVVNLDDKFFADRWNRPHGPRGTKVILIADPREYLVEALVGEYGLGNVAVFLCPNTDQIGSDRSRACLLVDRVYTPSSWCERTILAGVCIPTKVFVMPLGVDDVFVNNPISAREASWQLRYLHVTTDTFLPGRKGTEELIQAWKIAHEALGGLVPGETLTIHCLAQLHSTLHQVIGDAGLGDVIRLESGPARGSDSAALLELFSRHDFLVAPSRSEGFGIMPLSALVSGLPVLTTAGTGQDEYLVNVRALDGWMQIPTTSEMCMDGEEGLAPIVYPFQLALSLIATRAVYKSLKAGAGHFFGDEDSEPRERIAERWSWRARRATWAEHLIEWEKEAP